ncbi:MAG: hypothetical protein R3Y46_02900 [Opitutales bacterium]
MKKFLSIILITLLSGIAFAQDTQAKLDRAEALAISKAVALNDDSKALELLLDYAKNKEITPAFMYNIALLYGNLSKYEEAISYYSKAILGFKDFYLAHKNIAFCYANLANYELALEHISKAAALGGLDLQMYMCVAKANLSLNNFSEALFALKNAQMLSPKEESVRHNILFCLAKLEMWQELKNLSENILNEDKKSLNAWRSLLLALFNLDEQDEVIASVKSMQILGIAEDKDLELLANSYFNQELFEKAIEIYSFIKNNIEPEKLARIANVLVDTDALDKAIELAPDNALGNLAKARAYKIKADENSLKNAQHFANKALSQDPLSGKTLLFLAKLQIDDEQYAKAKLNLNRLKTNAEFAYESAYLLSYIAIKQGDYELALSLLRQIRNGKNFDYIDSYIKKIEKFLDT